MAKSKKIVKVGVKRESGFLYYVDKDGDISRIKANRRGRKRGTMNRRKL